mmetsp:Transcript_39527/g.65543  ORF Transcript_39527/g.65543 Transcript_39527/m.65543 type:complete len:257 (+) Transcript_39527:497-1267(+)
MLITVSASSASASATFAALALSTLALALALSSALAAAPSSAPATFALPSLIDADLLPVLLLVLSLKQRQFTEAGHLQRLGGMLSFLEAHIRQRLVRDQFDKSDRASHTKSLPQFENVVPFGKFSNQNNGSFCVVVGRRLRFTRRSTLRFSTCSLALVAIEALLKRLDLHRENIVETLDVREVHLRFVRTHQDEAFGVGEVRIVASLHAYDARSLFLFWILVVLQQVLDELRMLVAQSFVALEQRLRIRNHFRARFE